MTKFLASMTLVALFFAFTAPSNACDTEGKCKGKASAACCMSKAKSTKACCSSKNSSATAKVETPAEPAAAVVTTDAPAKAATTVKTVSTTKTNPNK